MPRRRPAEVRASIRAKSRPGAYVPRPHPRITGPLRTAIRRSERWPGEVDEILPLWERIGIRQEYWYYLISGCGVPDCCGPTADDRENLERVARRLPPKAAREFRRILHEIDEQVLRYRIGPSDWRDGWWHDT